MREDAYDEHPARQQICFDEEVGRSGNVSKLEQASS